VFCQVAARFCCCRVLPCLPRPTSSCPTLPDLWPHLFPRLTTSCWCSAGWSQSPYVKRGRPWLRLEKGSGPSSLIKASFLPLHFIVHVLFCICQGMQHVRCHAAMHMTPRGAQQPAQADSQVRKFLAEVPFPRGDMHCAAWCHAGCMQGMSMISICVQRAATQAWQLP